MRLQNLTHKCFIRRESKCMWGRGLSGKSQHLHIILATPVPSQLTPRPQAQLPPPRLPHGETLPLFWTRQFLQFSNLPYPDKLCIISQHTHTRDSEAHCSQHKHTHTLNMVLQVTFWLQWFTAFFSISFKAHYRKQTFPQSRESRLVGRHQVHLGWNQQTKEPQSAINT